MLKVGDRFIYTSTMFGTKFIVEIMGIENGKYGIFVYNEKGSLIDDTLKVVDKDFFKGDDIIKIGE